MNRRNFLKLIGATPMLPLAQVLANNHKALPKATTGTPGRGFTDEEDWVQKEIDKLSHDINEDDIGQILMSKQLIKELLKRHFNSSIETSQSFLFSGIPVIQSPILPFTTKKGNIHAFAIRRIPLSGWCTYGQKIVALEDIPKDGYGWAEIIPISPLKYYKL